MGVKMSKIWMSMGVGGAATFIIYSYWNMEKPVRKRTPILGLRNCGNTCFLNAILQALASCRYMLGWLSEKDEECNDHERPVQALESYQSVSYPLIAAMFRAILIMNREIDVDDWKYSGKVPGDVLGGLRANGHRLGFQQEQDAYEVFMMIGMALNHEVELSVRRKQVGSMGALTDGRPYPEEEHDWLDRDHGIASPDSEQHGDGDWAVIEKQGRFRVNDRIYSKRLVEKSMTYKSSPNSPLRCLLFSQMQCLVCMKKTSVRLEATDSLTLTLPPLDGSGAAISIHDLLEGFMKPTLVHNVDCDSCTRKGVHDPILQTCGGKVKSTFFKYNYMAKLPHTLCIHIPRCTWGPFGMLKRTDYIAFPERINLGLLQRLYDPNETSSLEESPDKSSADCNLRRFRNSEYHLTSVICHVGITVETGHFVTYRRLDSKENPNESKWYYTSDDLVYQVPFQVVQRTNAYMLFYEKTYTALL